MASEARAWTWWPSMTSWPCRWSTESMNTFSGIWKAEEAKESNPAVRVVVARLKRESRLSWSHGGIPWEGRSCPMGCPAPLDLDLGGLGASSSSSSHVHGGDAGRERLRKAFLPFELLNGDSGLDCGGICLPFWVSGSLESRLDSRHCTFGVWWWCEECRTSWSLLRERSLPAERKMEALVSESIL